MLNRRYCFSLRLVVLVLLIPGAILAQDEGPTSLDVPNAMGAHTRFIILALGALLVWAISYTLYLQREAIGRKRGQQLLLETKEHLLDRLAELESGRESGAVSEAAYKKQRRDLRQRLAKTLERLGGSPGS